MFAGKSVTYTRLELMAGLKVRKRQTPRVPRELLAEPSATQKAKLKPYRTC